MIKFCKYTLLLPVLGLLVSMAVAAPAVARIVTAVAAITGMPARDIAPEDDYDVDLLPYVKNPRPRGGKKLVSY